MRVFSSHYLVAYVGGNKAKVTVRMQSLRMTFVLAATRGTAPHLAQVSSRTSRHSKQAHLSSCKPGIKRCERYCHPRSPAAVSRWVARSFDADRETGTLKIRS